MFRAYHEICGNKEEDVCYHTKTIRAQCSPEFKKSAHDGVALSVAIQDAKNDSQRIIMLEYAISCGHIPWMDSALEILASMGLGRENEILLLEKLPSAHFWAEHHGLAKDERREETTVEVIGRLIDRYPELANRFFVEACQSMHLSLIPMLIDRGADIYMEEYAIFLGLEHLPELMWEQWYHSDEPDTKPVYDLIDLLIEASKSGDGPRYCRDDQGKLFVIATAPRSKESYQVIGEYHVIGASNLSPEHASELLSQTKQRTEIV